MTTIEGQCLCGSRMFARSEYLDQFNTQSVTASSLNDPSLFKPDSRIYTGEAQPWDCMSDACTQFIEAPR